jgi:hypothetical protein
MLRLTELVEKEKITFEELAELEEMVDIETEDNGMSGQYVGYHWYIVKTYDEEYNVYVK